MRLKTLSTAVAGLALLVPASTVSAQSKPTVAVLYFNNSALGKANEELAPLSKGIADLMINNLAGNSSIRVVERDRIQAVLDEQKLATDGKLDPATAVKVGKIVGAHHMITGVFITERATNTMKISVRVFNVETSEVEYGTDETGSTASIMSLIDKVSAKLSKGVKLPDIPAAAREEHAAAVKKQEKVPFQAVMLYSRALDAKDHGKKGEAVTVFKQSIQAFPSYDAPKKELEKMGEKVGN
jgi:TolB-like protein